MKKIVNVIFVLLGGVFVYTLFYPSKSTSGTITDDFNNGTQDGKTIGDMLQDGTIPTLQNDPSKAMTKPPSNYSIWFNAKIYWPGEVTLYKKNVDKYKRLMDQYSGDLLRWREYEKEYTKWNDAYLKALNMIDYYNGLYNQK